MRESSIDFSPYKKTHRATPSQHSNTLSEISCDTLASEIADNDATEAEIGEDTSNSRLSFEPEEYGSVWREVGGGKGEGLADSEWVREVVKEDVTIDIDDEEKAVIPKEPLKTLLSFLVLVTGFIATTTSLALTHDRVPDTAPLPDIVLDTVPYQQWGLDVSEVLLMVSTGTAILVVLAHSHRLVILRRIWFLLGILYYYRALTMFITVLPKADETYLCQPRASNLSAVLVVNRVLTLISGGGLSINGKQVYCGDYIFSGHTVTLTMGYLAIKQYSPSRFFLLHWASLITSFSGVIFLLLARGHYSIDVVVAYWISSRLWWTYHTMANIRHVKQSEEHNMFRGLWWWRAFRYFEANIAGPLPSQYSLPIPEVVHRELRRLWQEREGQGKEEQRS
jgi:shingomyelin synthase